MGETFTPAQQEYTTSNMCPNCVTLRARIAELEDRITTLLADQKSANHMLDGYATAVAELEGALREWADLYRHPTPGTADSWHKAQERLAALTDRPVEGGTDG